MRVNIVEEEVGWRARSWPSGNPDPHVYSPRSHVAPGQTVRQNKGAEPKVMAAPVFTEIPPPLQSHGEAIRFNRTAHVINLPFGPWLRDCTLIGWKLYSSFILNYNFNYICILRLVSGVWSLCVIPLPATVLILVRAGEEHKSVCIKYETMFRSQEVNADVKPLYLAWTWTLWDSGDKQKG